VAEDLFLPYTNAMQTRKAISVDESEVGDARKFAFNEKTARDLALHKALKVYKHQLKKQWKQEYPGYEQDNYRRNDCSEQDALHNPVDTASAEGGKFGRSYAVAPRKAMAKPIGYGLEPEDATDVVPYVANEHPVAKTKSYSIDGQGMKAKGGLIGAVIGAVTTAIPLLIGGIKALVKKIKEKRAAKAQANNPMMNREYQEMMERAYRYRRPRPEDIEVRGSGDMSAVGVLRDGLTTAAHMLDKVMPGKGMKYASEALDAKTGAGFADWVMSKVNGSHKTPKVLRYKHVMEPIIRFHLKQHPEYQKDPRYAKAMKRFLTMSPLFHKKVAHGYGLFDMISAGLGQVLSGVATHVADPKLLQVIGDAAPYLQKGIASVGSAASKFPGHKLFAAAAPAMFGTAATYMIHKATAPLRAKHPEEAALVSGLLGNVLGATGIGKSPTDLSDVHIEDMAEPTKAEVDSKRAVLATFMRPESLTDKFVVNRIKMEKLTALKKHKTAAAEVKEADRIARKAEKEDEKMAKKARKSGVDPAKLMGLTKPYEMAGMAGPAPMVTMMGPYEMGSAAPKRLSAFDVEDPVALHKAAKKAAKKLARPPQSPVGLFSPAEPTTDDEVWAPAYMSSKEDFTSAQAAPATEEVDDFDALVSGSGRRRAANGKFLPKGAKAKSKGGAMTMSEARSPRTFRDFHGATIKSASVIDGQTTGHAEENKSAPTPGALVLPSANTKNLYYQNRLKNPKAGSVFKLSKKMAARS
jgi:hypothetical protein